VGWQSLATGESANAWGPRVSKTEPAKRVEPDSNLTLILAATRFAGFVSLLRCVPRVRGLTSWLDAGTLLGLPHRTINTTHNSGLLDRVNGKRACCHSA